MLAHPYAFGKELVDAGIIPPHTRRVVIDAQIDEPVKVFTEGYADAMIQAIDLKGSLRGAAVNEGCCGTQGNECQCSKGGKPRGVFSALTFTAVLTIVAFFAGVGFTTLLR